MDVVASAAETVVRHSTYAIEVAATELAKQASTVVQMATSKEAVSWLTGGEESPGLTDTHLEEDLTVVPRRQQPHVMPVPLTALRSWGAEEWRGAEVFAPAPAPAPEGCEQLAAAEEQRGEPPFSVDHELNSKIALWEGDPCALETDALLASTAAGYAVGSSTLFQKVLDCGGADFYADLKQLDSCRSGEARITKAYGLPCRWLVLTVGPKYKEKYRIAAQNTLNACYRECLQQVVDTKLRTVTIPCTWYHKGYPPEEHAHVALRTIRRCLEKMRHSIDALVLAAATPSEALAYESLLPLYFPRRDCEAALGARTLPEGAWSEWGEVTVEERRIRVSSFVFSADEEDEGEDRKLLFSPTDDADRGFLDAKGDADRCALERLDCSMTEAETQEQARHACLRYIRRAYEIRGDDQGLARFVYTPGCCDQFGRKVVVLLGARLPGLGIRDEKTVPLIVRELERLKGARFLLLYTNSCMPTVDTANLEVLHEVVAVLNARYRSSLDTLLVLHPGYGFRAAFALGTALSDAAASIWTDTVYLDRVEDLSAYIVVDQLQLPDFVRASG